MTHLPQEGGLGRFDGRAQTHKSFHLRLNYVISLLFLLCFFIFCTLVTSVGKIVLIGIKPN